MLAFERRDEIPGLQHFAGQGGIESSRPMQLLNEHIAKGHKQGKGCESHEGRCRQRVPFGLRHRLKHLDRKRERGDLMGRPRIMEMPGARH